MPEELDPKQVQEVANKMQSADGAGWVALVRQAPAGLIAAAMCQNAASLSSATGARQASRRDAARLLAENAVVAEMTSLNERLRQANERLDRLELKAGTLLSVLGAVEHAAAVLAFAGLLLTAAAVTLAATSLLPGRWGLVGPVIVLGLGVAFLGKLWPQLRLLWRDVTSRLHRTPPR